MDKATQVYDKMTKEALNWGAIASKVGKGLGKTQVKGTKYLAKAKDSKYLANVKKDFNLLTSGSKSIAGAQSLRHGGTLGRNVKGDYARRMAAGKKDIMKSLPGLAGRVGLPAYIAGDIIT